MSFNKPSFSLMAVAFVVTSYISFALVAINAGLGPDFWWLWLRSWFIAFIMAVPSLRYVGPFVRNLIASQQTLRNEK